MSVREVHGHYFSSYQYNSLWAPLSDARRIDSTGSSIDSRSGSSSGVPEMAGALFMYRSNDGLGKWIVTNREHDFGSNRGCVSCHLISCFSLLNRLKNLLCPALLTFHLEFDSVRRFLRLSENQGVPSLPFEFPELSLSTSQSSCRSASMYSSTSYTTDAERRSFHTKPAAFSDADVSEVYAHHETPVTVQRASDTIPPRVAVLSSRSSHAASTTNPPDEPTNIEGCAEANSLWFCAPCGGNATAAAFAHCLHCGLPRSSSSSSCDGSDDSIHATSVATPSITETLPESDLTAEVRKQPQR